MSGGNKRPTSVISHSSRTSAGEVSSRPGNLQAQLAGQAIILGHPCAGYEQQVILNALRVETGHHLSHGK